MRTELSIILQIILESLPISSSGNLALLGLMLPTAINYAAHSATLVIYALFFRKKLCTLLFHPLRCFKNILHAIFFGICALVPTVVCYAFIEYAQPAFPLWLGFLITTLALFSTKYAHTEQPHGFDPAHHERPLALSGVERNRMGTTAFIIGCAQGVALLPGISRLGITYAAGRWLGLSWRTSFAFSCMIEAPLIFVASIKGLFDLRIELFTVSVPALIGYILATALSYLILCGVYKMAQKNSWWIFGIYTSLLSILAYMR